MMSLRLPWSEPHKINLTSATMRQKILSDKRTLRLFDSLNWSLNKILLLKSICCAQTVFFSGVQGFLLHLITSYWKFSWTTLLWVMWFQLSHDDTKFPIVSTWQWKIYVPVGSSSSFGAQSRVKIRDERLVTQQTIGNLSEENLSLYFALLTIFLINLLISYCINQFYILLTVEVCQEKVSDNSWENFRSLRRGISHLRIAEISMLVTHRWLMRREWFFCFLTKTQQKKSYNCDQCV